VAVPLAEHTSPVAVEQPRNDAATSLPRRYASLLVGKAPIIADIPAVARLVDPTVQVLVLTDVVIEATVTALLLALVVQAHKRFGSLDPADLRPLRD